MRHFYDMTNVASQLVASILVAMLLSVAPLASAAWSSAAWQRGRTMLDPALGPRPLPSIFTLFVAAAVIMLLPGLIHTSPHYRVEALLQTAVVVLAFLAGVLGLLRLLYQLGWRSRFLIGMWIVLMWIGPLVVDWARQIVLYTEPSGLEEISAASPIGALAHIWSYASNLRDVPMPVTGGLIFQGAVGGALLLAAMLMERRRTPPAFPVAAAS